MGNGTQSTGDIIIYQTDDGLTKIDVVGISDRFARMVLVK